MNRRVICMKVKTVNNELTFPLRICQQRLQHGEHAVQLSVAYHEVPERLHLLPAAHVEQMGQLLLQIVVAKAGAEDVAPGIELLVGPVVALLQFLGSESYGLVDDRARVVLAPVVRGDAAVALHLLEQACAGIGREDMEGGRGDAVLDAPLHCSAEHVLVVVIKAEHEAAVDHDAQAMQSLDSCHIVLREILQLIARAQILWREGLEAEEDTAQPSLGSLLYQVALQHGGHRGSTLEDAPHAAHALKQFPREMRTAQQVVVEEIEVAAWQAVYLSQGLIDALHIERLALAIERILIAEVAVMRTAARHDERVGHEVFLALDEVASDGRDVLYRPPTRHIALLRMAGPQVTDEAREGLLAWSQKNRVDMLRRLVGQRRDVQAAHGHIGALLSIVVGNAIGPVGIGHIHLYAHQVRLVVERQPLHMLVHDLHFVVVAKVGSQRGQPQRRKQRVLDGAPIGALGFLQGWQYHFYFHGLT